VQKSELELKVLVILDWTESGQTEVKCLLWRLSLDVNRALQYRYCSSMALVQFRDGRCSCDSSSAAHCEERENNWKSV